MKIIKAHITFNNKLSPKTVEEIYSICEPKFQTENIISLLIKNAVSTLNKWQAQIYECEFSGAIIIFSYDKILLGAHTPKENERRADMTGAIQYLMKEKSKH